MSSSVSSPPASSCSSYSFSPSSSSSSSSSSTSSPSLGSTVGSSGIARNTGVDSPYTTSSTTTTSATTTSTTKEGSNHSMKDSNFQSRSNRSVVGHSRGSGGSRRTNTKDSSSRSNRRSWISYKQQLQRQETFFLEYKHYFFSRRPSSLIRTHDLPYEDNHIGMYSFWAVFWYSLFLTVPLAYTYIGLILIRELCVYSPTKIHWFVQTYLPLLGRIIQKMISQPSKLVETWCIIEGIFFIFCKLQIYWLQSIDPLEASLHSAPLMDAKDRQVLWNRMMETEYKSPVTFITGWFFDLPLESISKNDARNFIAWSMFEGRNQEHLTSKESQQLDRFLQELEHIITLHLIKNKTTTTDSNDQEVIREEFHFQEILEGTPPNFFSDLYETYHRRYEMYRNMVENADFHPVQDIRNFMTAAEEATQNSTTANNLRNFMAETAHRMERVEESAVTAAAQTANNLRNFMAETAQTIVEAEETAVSAAQQTASNMYATFVPKGSHFDKQLTAALSHAPHLPTIQLLTDTWNSITTNMKERLETAQYLSDRRKKIQQQLHGYQNMLDRMRAMSSGVPSKQMALLMRRITNCYIAMEKLEVRAREAFVTATEYYNTTISNNNKINNSNINDDNNDGDDDNNNKINDVRNNNNNNNNNNAKNNNTTFLKTLQQLQQKKEPQRYGSYSADPILGIASFPLFFHVAILGVTEIPLRIWMHNNGFQRRTVGKISYYFRPGRDNSSDYHHYDRNYGDNSKPNNDDDWNDNSKTNDDDTNTKNHRRNNSNHRHTTSFVNVTNSNFSGAGMAFDDEDDDNDADDSPHADDDDDADDTPHVFVHGIGLGLIMYLPLIQQLMESGRPIILPEIPYVSGFRNIYQGPNSVLQPAVVCSTITAILATHGFLQGNFIGHSYGTAWLSYMCKYAPQQVASLLFLDPICFCLHFPFLTQQFVYKQRDVGTVSYMVRSDVIVNWTIQRSFPWSQVILFVEHILRHNKHTAKRPRRNISTSTSSTAIITAAPQQHETTSNNNVQGKTSVNDSTTANTEHTYYQYHDHDNDDDDDEYEDEEEDDGDYNNRNIPCAIFLSELDALCPTDKVVSYLKDKIHNIPIACCDSKIQKSSSTKTKITSSSSSSSSSSTTTTTTTTTSTTSTTAAKNKDVGDDTSQNNSIIERDSINNNSNNSDNDKNNNATIADSSSSSSSNNNSTNSSDATTKSNDTTYNNGNTNTTEYPLANKSHFYKGDINVCIFREHGHGDWTVDSNNFCNEIIGDAAHVLASRAAAAARVDSGAVIATINNRTDVKKKIH